MDLRDVQKLLDAKICAGGEYLDRQVETCCGSDLMSDVLAFTKCKTLLFTGLSNMQVIRTADMTDLCGVILVRGNCREKICCAKRQKISSRSCRPTIRCLRPAVFFTATA